MCARILGQRRESPFPPPEDKTLHCHHRHHLLLSSSLSTSIIIKDNDFWSPPSSPPLHLQSPSIPFPTGTAPIITLSFSSISPLLLSFIPFFLYSSILNVYSLPCCITPSLPSLLYCLPYLAPRFLLKSMLNSSMLWNIPMILFLVLVILSIYDGLIVDARRDSRQSLSLVRPTKAPKEDLPSIFPCNGDIRYCHLRYDQYTFAGSHNSGAYNLSFDCSTALGMTKFLCYRGIPNPLMNCLWNNMGDRNLLRQLRDGMWEEGITRGLRKREREKKERDGLPYSLLYP